MAFPAKEGIKLPSVNPVAWVAGLISSSLLLSVSWYKVKLKNLMLLIGTAVDLILGSVSANHIHAS